jgi:hypothetical protein
MVTNVSKTYSFNPSAGELILNAFGRINVRPSELTQSHLYQARLSANFVLSEWSGRQPNLWEVGLQTVPLLQGIATYTVPAETVMILDMYVSYGNPTTDRFIYPISRTEYAALPNKTFQSFPNQFWFDRLVSPTITLYPVPDANGPYVIKYYSVRQTQDAVLAGGLNVEVPYRWLDAFVAALAWRLAEIYAPQMEQRCEQKAERAWALAATQDQENVPLMIVPGTASYWRR